MQENFSATPEAITNTQKIADLCNLKLNLGQTILPEYALPKGETAVSYLKKLAEQGFKTRYAQDNERARKQFLYEFSIIEKTGFADYFLIVADFISWAKNEKIMVGPGRGSAAGSVVSYCLGITDIEPLQYNLLFERFLNPERISMPDIDIDFADDRRDEVIEYVKNKYGEEHVAQIITFGTMAARGSIRDTTRALGMGYTDGDRIAKLIPTGNSIAQALDEVSELKQTYDREPEIKKMIEMAKKLEGVARHASTHACGIVISKEPLTEYLPLQQAQKGQTSITTQYPMFDIESIGLLKMDFLGLSNLTVIKNALRIIRKIKNAQIDISKIPLDDKKHSSF
ncbi:MAG: DNA polymerase III subunit alpha [Patescibacteria group bacterium]|nr:DNA polymerase III subunit alpha [Patescibacteria group bacterium]